MPVSATRRYVVEKGEGIDGPPIPSDEPCIVIRAQDVLALEMMDHYLLRYQQLPDPLIDQNVVRELEDHRDEILDWQYNHTIKIADR